MRKTWEHTVTVQAPAEQVWALVSDFNRHPEWDKFTKRVEQSKPGDANGVGAEWKVYEQLGLFMLGESVSGDSKHLTALAKREVREVEPGKSVTWRTHSVPNVGVGADFTYTLVPVAGGTEVSMKVGVDVPALLERVRRTVLTNMDNRQQGQWMASLEQLKAQAEAAKPAYATA
jgi:uncharacterized membrane protein